MRRLVDTDFQQEQSQLQSQSQEQESQQSQLPQLQEQLLQLPQLPQPLPQLAETDIESLLEMDRVLIVELDSLLVLLSLLLEESSLLSLSFSFVPSVMPCALSDSEFWRTFFVLLIFMVQASSAVSEEFREDIDEMADCIIY